MDLVLKNCLTSVLKESFMLNTLRVRNVESALRLQGIMILVIFQKSKYFIIFGLRRKMLIPMIIWVVTEWLKGG
jgi:hypothetical protein